MDTDRERVPFGVSQLDGRIGGGAPAGSVVLLAGEAGAGAREFGYTSAVTAGLGHADAELFDLHYGSLGERARLPDSVHYVSLTGSESELQSEMGFAMDPDIVEAGLEAVTFADLSPEYFQLSPVPREWYAGAHGTLTDLGRGDERRSVVESLADYFDENARDSLLIVDSLTDLAGVQGQEAVAWQDVVYLVKGLRKAAREWNGLVLLHVSREAISDTRFGDLMTSVDGTMLFEWATGGNERVRTLVVREFRGVLSQLEAEDIARFETEIHDVGFDISNVRKIR